MNGFDLKIARLRAGVRGYELARHVGITESMLSRIETGRRVVAPDELGRLVAAVDGIAAGGRVPLAAGCDAVDGGRVMIRTTIGPQPLHTENRIPSPASIRGAVLGKVVDRDHITPDA